MSRPGRSIQLRAGSWAWLAILSVFALARPAGASTCHEPERPTLGLTPAWVADIPSAPALDASPSTARLRFRTRPCPAEQPGPNPTRSTPPDAFAGPSAPIDRPPPMARSSADSPGLSGPIASVRPLERPPRPHLPGRSGPSR